MSIAPGTNVPIGTVSRDGVIECVHYGRIAICAPDGRLLASAGDPQAVQFWRSASKSIQALSVVTTGAAEQFALTQKELSVCCASHSGSADHVATVLGILSKLGLDESALDCGTQVPGDAEERNRLICEGEEPSQLHNNCSGKHACMLATARGLGVPVEGYLNFSHPVQRLIAANMSLLSKVPEERFAVGRDGCGAPTVAMPLASMARAFARMAGPDDLPAEIAQAARTIAAATAAEPVMVSSAGSFNSELLAAGEGDIIAKGGAEGLFCLASTSRQVGIAVKCSDGSGRPLPPVAIALMRRFGIEVPEALAERFERVPITNRHYDTVGHVEAIDLALTMMA